MRYVVQVKFQYEVESDETIAEVTNRMNKRIVNEYKPTKIMIFVDEYEFAMKREAAIMAGDEDDHEGCCPPDV